MRILDGAGTRTVQDVGRSLDKAQGVPRTITEICIRRGTLVNQTERYLNAFRHGIRYSS